MFDLNVSSRCFCSEKRLELLRRECLRTRSPSKYDGRCRDLSEAEVEEKLARGDPYTVRFRMPQEGEALSSFEDVLYGRVTHDVAAVEGDPIVVKSDGLPTYHLASVIDDHLMRVSHVLRGVEWQGRTGGRMAGKTAGPMIQI